MPYNFAAGSFHTKKLCSRLSSCEVRLEEKRPFCVFEPPFGGHRGNVRWSSLAHWKARRALPTSVNWTFFVCIPCSAVKSLTAAQRHFGDVLHSTLSSFAIFAVLVLRVAVILKKRCKRLSCVTLIIIIILSPTDDSWTDLNVLPLSLLHPGCNLTDAGETPCRMHTVPQVWS